MAIEVQITSLQELISELPHCSSDDYYALANDMELDVQDLARYATWSADRYTRNCIVRTEKYELILLCWEAGQETSIHCHGGEECWVYGAHGSLEEVHYSTDGQGCPQETGRHILQVGQVTYMNDNIGYHLLQNVGHQRAMSLHLYMNPIDQCTCWDEELKQFVPTDLAYDTYAGKSI